MPTLYLSASGEYYIKTRNHEGAFQTFQVEPLGVGHIKRRGLPVPSNFKQRDGIEIPKSVFEELQDRGWLYVRGNGRRGEETIDPLVSRPERFYLAFREKRSFYWELAIILPRLPEEWQQIRISALPSGCGLRTGNLAHVSAERIWASGEGELGIVQPQLHHYPVRAQGRWPTSLRISEYIHDVRGLHPHINFFADIDYNGQRLRTGQNIYPGRSYYLLSMDALHIPALLKPLALSTRLNWRAWKITMPFHLGRNEFAVIGKWCEELGYRLRELQWRMVLLSPPVLGHTENGYPLLPAGTQAVVEVMQPTNPEHGSKSIELEFRDEQSPSLRSYVAVTHTLKSIKGRHYIGLTLEKPGEYLIREREGRTRTLRFTVQEATALYEIGGNTTGKRAQIATHITSTKVTYSASRREKRSGKRSTAPSFRPLEICVSSGFQKDVYQVSTWDAHAGKMHWVYIDLEKFESSDTLRIEVTCSARVSVQWRCASQSGQVENIESATVADVLTPYLALPYSTFSPFDLSFYAGESGKLHMRLLPPVTRSGVYFLYRVKQRMQRVLMRINRNYIPET